ncbi:MAG: hypothetical protein KCHDKBKB_00299 [Elusimicrobia bacterium]|nr:hypothetical protein [Elusimicrobiota bacterium]
MKSIHTFIAFTFLINSISGVLKASDAIPPLGLTLKECYQLAVNRSERLLISQENMIQAQARRKQALGAVLPDVRWLLATTWQDTTGTQSDGDGDRSSVIREERTESKFQVKQPLFQGFKEFSAISGYKAEERRAQAQLMSESVALFLEVAKAFYQVLQLETLREDLRMSIDLAEDRLKELKERTRLGKSRESEVLSSESQLASLEALVARNEGNILSARYALAFLVGLRAKDLKIRDEAFPFTFESEEQVLGLGQNRSDLRALKEDVEAKRAGVRVARSGYYPYANVLGNYYTHRVGTQENVDWDVAFNLDVPFFQGGGVKALSEEALSRLNQSELNLERQTRVVETEIGQAFATLQSSIEETAALEEAYKKAKRSYDSQVKEYRYGLLNNLEVLQAMNSMLNLKVQYDTAVLQAKLDHFKLKAVIEDIP